MPCDAEPLALAAGILVRIAVEMFGSEADLLEQRRRHVAPVVSCDSGVDAGPVR